MSDQNLPPLSPPVFGVLLGSLAIRMAETTNTTREQVPDAVDPAVLATSEIHGLLKHYFGEEEATIIIAAFATCASNVQGPRIDAPVLSIRGVNDVAQDFQMVFDAAKVLGKDVVVAALKEAQDAR